MNFLKSLYDLFADLIYTLWCKTNQHAEVTKKKAKQYFKILLWLTLITIGMPLIPALIGLAGGWHWLISAAGLMWGFFALLLFILAAPLGILINLILEGLGFQKRSPKAGQRYTSFVGSILLFGMFFALMIALVPWRENPKLIPLLLLASAILAVGGTAWGTAGILGKKTVIFTTSIVLVVLITSLFFPTSFTEINSARQELDSRFAEMLRGKLVSGTNLPVCAETEETHIITASNPRVEIPIWEYCWSGWIDIQTNQKVNFRFYQQPEVGFLEVYFMDGSRRLIHKNERVWFGHIPKLTFRLRGSGQKAVVEIQ